MLSELLEKLTEATTKYGPVREEVKQAKIKRAEAEELFGTITKEKKNVNEM